MRTFISLGLFGLATTALAAPPATRPDSKSEYQPGSSHSNHTEPASITASSHSSHTEPSSIVESSHSGRPAHQHNATHTESWSSVSFTHFSHPAYPTATATDDGKGPAGSRLVPGFTHHGHKREAEAEGEHHFDDSHFNHTEPDAAAEGENHYDHGHSNHTRPEEVTEGGNHTESHFNHTESATSTASSYKNHPDYGHKVNESDSDDGKLASGAHLVPGYGDWHGHKRDTEDAEEIIKGDPISLPAPVNITGGL